METTVAIIRSLGNPRYLFLLLLFLGLLCFLLYQYARNRKSDASRRVSTGGKEMPFKGNKSKDTLIAGLGLLLVISFLGIAVLLVYLLLQQAG